MSTDRRDLPRDQTDDPPRPPAGTEGAAGTEETADTGPCEACGSPQARSWATPDGPARLCPPCATLNGIGCP